MKNPRNSIARGVPARIEEGNFEIRSARRRLTGLVLAVLTLAASAAWPLPAQPPRSLSLPPSITIVGTNDKDCQESLADLQRLIHEFAFVRGQHLSSLRCARMAQRASSSNSGIRRDRSLPRRHFRSASARNLVLRRSPAQRRRSSNRRRNLRSRTRPLRLHLHRRIRGRQSRR
jgi:hypothetical protein